MLANVNVTKEDLKNFIPPVFLRGPLFVFALCFIFVLSALGADSYTSGDYSYSGCKTQIDCGWKKARARGCGNTGDICYSSGATDDAGGAILAFTLMGFFGIIGCFIYTLSMRPTANTRLDIMNWGFLTSAFCYFLGCMIWAGEEECGSSLNNNQLSASWALIFVSFLFHTICGTFLTLQAYDITSFEVPFFPLPHAMQQPNATEAAPIIGGGEPQPITEQHAPHYPIPKADGGEAEAEAAENQPLRQPPPNAPHVGFPARKGGSDFTKMRSGIMIDPPPEFDDDDDDDTDDDDEENRPIMGPILHQQPPRTGDNTIGPRLPPSNEGAAAVPPPPPASAVPVAGPITEVVTPDQPPAAPLRQVGLQIKICSNPECNKKNSVSSKFCGNCGQKFA